ncbi:MAG: carbohydrate-binding family 9-like protein [Armatimonadota bacterium]|nr:carbohydrate-binding family 9-like protein [Armatimonadota bacterium]
MRHVLGSMLLLGVMAVAGVGADVPLVRDGRPVATIVVAEETPLAVQLAVAELNHHIEQMTGAPLPVATDADQVQGPVVLVGESAHTRELGLRNEGFAKQEYLVQARPEALILMGRDAPDTGEFDYQARPLPAGFSYYTPMGSCYAVYDFLERCCGVRWYLPTEIGTVIPERDTLVVEEVSVRRSPWTRHRSMWPQRPIPASLYHWDMSDPEELAQIPRLPGREERLYWLRQRMGGEHFAANHSFYPWQERFGESHPEYFAVNEAGEPMLDQLNYASEAVVEQAVEDILACRRGEWEDENGIRRFGRASENIFPLVPMDNRQWSQDPQTQAMLVDPPTRTIGSFNTNRASRYIFSFVAEVARRVAERDPDAIISALAYSDYYFPPEGIEFPDNVAIMVCKQQVKARTRRFDDAYYASLREWSRKVDMLYTWEYYNFPQWRRMNVFPGLVPRRTGHDVVRLHEIGIDGEFIEINTAKGFPPVEGWLVNPAMQHLNYYFRLKMFDRVDRPIEELLDEYYRLFYGPAEEPMRRFFTTIEETFMNEQYYRPGHLRAEESWTVYCPPERLRELRRMIHEAGQLAEGQSPYAERVQLIDEAILAFMKASARPFYMLEQKGPPTYEVGRAPEGFTWEDAAASQWQEAPATEVFGRSTGQKAPVDTVARALWDDDALYVLFECSEPKMELLEASDRPRDGGVFFDDCVELFVDADRDQGRYRHFVVNAVGSIYDEWRVANRPKTTEQVAWDSGIEARADTGEDRWTVALRIPLQDLARPPKSGAQWGMNFCRHRTCSGGNLSWSPTGMSFHAPSRFGVVTFVSR